MAGQSNGPGLSQGMAHHVLQNGPSQNKLYVVMTDNAQVSIDKTIRPIHAPSVAHDILLRNNSNGQSDMCFTTDVNKASGLTPNTGATMLTRLTPPFTPDMNSSVHDDFSVKVINPDILYMTPVNNGYNPKMRTLTPASDKPYMIPVSDPQSTTLKTRDCVKRNLTGISDEDFQASVPRNGSSNFHVFSNSSLLQAPVKQRKSSCQVFTDVKDRGISRFFNNYSATALEDSINDFDHLFTKPTSAMYSSVNGSHNNGQSRPVMEGPPGMQMEDICSASLTQPPLRCSLVFSSPPAASSQGAKFVMATPENFNASASASSMGIDAYRTPTNDDLAKNPAVRKILISEPIPMNDKGSMQTSVVVNPNDQGICLNSVGGKVDNSGKGMKLNVKQRTEAKTSSRDTKGAHSANRPEKGDKQTKTSKGNLNDSLTNIQWLGGINFDDQLPKNKLDLTDNEVERVSKECGSSRRPPYSYMLLIQMALNSREDRKMTLREICKWIEDKFPFYKHASKPGWKNSIRHNLSLYNIFVREPHTKHGSRWTVKTDCSPKAKFSRQSSSENIGDQAPTARASLFPVYHMAFNNISTLQPVMMTNNMPQSIHPAHQMSGNMQQSFHQTNQMSSSVQQPIHSTNQKAQTGKKGPTPILPRPMPMQTYALVPIQSPFQPVANGNPACPMIVHQSQCLPSSPMLISDESQGSTSDMIQTKVVPKEFVDVKPSALGTSDHSILHEAWIQAGTSMASKPLAAGMIPINIQVVKVEQYALPESTTSKEYVSISPAKKAKVIPGLPKPKMYNSPNKKRKSDQKTSKESKLDDSSESESELSIDTEIPTPLREFLELPLHGSNSKMSTSTPFLRSPQFQSPNRGYTPLKNVDIFNGSFFDFIQKENIEGRLMLTPGKNVELCGLGCSPGSSWIDISLLTTPESQRKKDKHTQNLTKFLSDFPMDTNFVEEIELTSNMYSLT